MSVFSMYPVDVGRWGVIQGYSPAHMGIDIPVPLGTSVQSVEAGEVLYAGWSQNVTPADNTWYTLPGSSFAGIQVVVRHRNGFITNYCHLSSLSVRKGQAVARGQIVGLSGQTGLASGPHLHYETIQISTMPIGGSYGRVDPRSVTSAGSGDWFASATDADLRRVITETAFNKADGAYQNDLLGKVFSKRDGAYQNALVADMIAALGRIETQTK